MISVPLRWLSSVVIKYSMNLRHDLISSQWRWGATLAPLAINDNPFFINAIDSLDVRNVRTWFLKGLAKRTDHVLYEGRLSLGIRSVSCLPSTMICESPLEIQISAV